ncbi:hypothetical protein F3Y22_tig00002840pilonHSYRG01196 [Hibiscus syriacus]|uniref:Uncharacterized protein n=1 Tax=Hibiscus syriacus TaxID=106335 RepID=A0A6A3CSE5_HIBSY|nr:hypothetical protein F3Y22_tig00002840pilonHSYRG01196 [Hibiscus syriacus]
MLQNPPHCEASPNAAAMEEQGPQVGRSHPVRCTCGTWQSMWDELPEIRGAVDVPDHPVFKKLLIQAEEETDSLTKAHCRSRATSPFSKK